MNGKAAKRAGVEELKKAAEKLATREVEMAAPVSRLLHICAAACSVFVLAPQAGLSGGDGGCDERAETLWSRKKQKKKKEKKKRKKQLFKRRGANALAAYVFLLAYIVQIRHAGKDLSDQGGSPHPHPHPTPFYHPLLAGWLPPPTPLPSPPLHSSAHPFPLVHPLCVSAAANDACTR